MAVNERGSKFLTLSTAWNYSAYEYSVIKTELKFALLTNSDFSSYVEMCFIVIVDWAVKALTENASIKQSLIDN